VMTTIIIITLIIKKNQKFPIIIMITIMTIKQREIQIQM